MSLTMGSICMRENCNTYGLKYVYIKYGREGYTFFGRCVSDILILLKEFSVPLPYSDLSTFFSDSNREELEHALHGCTYERISYVVEPNIMHFN